MKNKNNTGASLHYRQGDVAIERIGSLPAKLNKVARENGRVILAHGEVTGHAHSFAEDVAQKYTDEKGAEFFTVGGTPIQATLPVLRRWKKQVMVHHPELGIIEFHQGDVEIIGDQVTVDGEFGLLKHDEHHAHGVPAGFYRGGADGGKVRQREYTPQGIRNTAD